MSIKINFAPLEKVLRGIGRQTNFGVSQALNEWVEVYKLRAIDDLPKYFKIRSGWVARKFRTEHAKRDKLEAVVGHKEAFMKAQAEGGTKVAGPGPFGQGIPQAGGTTGSIPMPRGKGGERPTYRGGNWPRQLLAAVRMFETKLGKARGKKTPRASERAFQSAANTRAATNRLVFLKNAKVPTIAIRIASGNGTGKYLPLWFLKNAPVKIPKRWRFYEDGEAFANSNLAPLMEWHINKWINKIGVP